MTQPSPAHAQAPASTATRTRLAAGLGSILVIAVLAAFAAGALPRYRQAHAVRATTRELAIPSVTLVSPAPSRSSGALLLPAEVRPWTDAAILARASGYVRRWHAELGAHVSRGDLLVELDTPELNQERDALQAQLQQAEAAAHLAETTLNRWRQMHREALVPQQELDEKDAESRLRNAVVQSARAALHRVEELLRFAHITAPFDGVVTARRVDVGQLVATSSPTELYRIAQVDTLRVFVRVPQSFATSLSNGLAAEVLLDGRNTRPLQARLVRTSAALDAASRTRLAELELPNPDQSILPGGFAQVRFTGLHADVPLAVPANTLLFRSDGPTLATVRPDNHVELRRVRLGRDLGTSVEILEGLSATDRLILNPPDSITDGIEVRVVANPGTTPPR